jgi:hypothetical protein
VHAEASSSSKSGSWRDVILTNRLGAKSPFLLNSELSTHTIVDSRTMLRVGATQQSLLEPTSKLQSADFAFRDAAVVMTAV